MGVRIPANKLVLKNPISWNNSHTPNPFKQPLSLVCLTWQDRCRKVSMSAFNFSPTPRNFDFLQYEPSRSKAKFSTGIPRGQNPRFPDGAGRTLKSRSRPLPNAPRDEILPQGRPSLLICTTNRPRNKLLPQRTLVLEMLASCRITAFVKIALGASSRCH